MLIEEHFLSSNIENVNLKYFNTFRAIIGMLKLKLKRLKPLRLYIARENSGLGLMGVTVVAQINIDYRDLPLNTLT